MVAQSKKIYIERYILIVVCNSSQRRFHSIKSQLSEQRFLENGSSVQVHINTTNLTTNNSFATSALSPPLSSVSTHTTSRCRDCFTFSIYRFADSTNSRLSPAASGYGQACTRMAGFRLARAASCSKAVTVVDL